MPNESFTPQESLKLITNMIQKTKENISESSHYFLLWGWAGFAAFIVQFILKNQLQYEHHYIVWLVSFPCLIIMMIWIKRDQKKEQVRTYVSESMGYLWAGVGMAMFVVSIVFAKIGFQYCYPFFILLYAIGTYISGRILNFKPLVYGGLINFVLAAGCAWVEYDYQMLFGAAAILTSYIIPGHMLRSRFVMR
jgi:hypothetical protein